MKIDGKRGKQQRETQAALDMALQMLEHWVKGRRD